MKKIWVLVILIGICVGLIPTSLKGQTSPVSQSPVFSNGAEALPTSQIIIKFTDNTLATARLADSQDNLLSQLSQAAGVSVAYGRPMSGEAHVLILPQAYPAKDVAGMAAEMEKVAGVEYAEPDLIKTIDGRAAKSLFIPNLTPNDTRFGEQWHYVYTPNTAEGLNLLNAWDISTGSASTKVAVIDTGILAHTDLTGKTVPGYDFIDDVAVANDGDGRDSNPADPGDWVVANECGYPHSGSNSSWHGTHVAGTIGAATNNSLGVAGVNWNAKILPVRVLGKCGGYTSDIVDGMRWAAGLAVTGVPANANPAKVLNLSLGGVGACSATEQTAINAIVAAGSTVVIAAGNDSANASGYSPGNCNNIITVAATNRNGDMAWYSNFGSIIEVSAPGGETDVTSNGILSTLDTGTTTPNNSNTYAFYQGTSMATPHVAGVASLILGLRPAYTPAQVLSVLQSTARSFPGGSSCNTSLCGVGIVDAYQALNSINVTFTDTNYLPVIMKPLPAPTPTPTPTTPPPVTPITNPGFESGPTGWIEFSTHGWNVIINSGFPGGITPHGGSWAAWLGGDYDDISYIQQTVTVPASTPYLTYWHWIASEDFCGNYDVGGVLVNGTVVDDYDLCNDTGGWVRHSVNLAAYAGQTVAVQIRVETDGSYNSNLFVDDVSFQASAAADTIPGGQTDGQTAVPKSALMPTP